MLNRVLPDDVRALAWAPVAEGFSARFSCASRTYRYWLARENAHGRPRDVEAMRRAASKFVGDHDFRNFCKMDARPRRLDPLHTPSPRLGRLKRRSCT